MRKKLIALIFAFGILSANGFIDSACAQTAATDPAPVVVQEIVERSAQQAETDAVDAGVTSSEIISISSEGLVSLDFREADIRNVLKILALKGGVNIVASPEVVGTVSIQLTEVPWQEALDVILRTYGYVSEKRGSIVVVTTVDKLKQRRDDESVLAEQEPRETRTYVLNFGRASEIIESLDKMKTERGSINFDERTNAVIATDIPKQLDLMEKVILTLDRTTPQVLIEAKIVETNFSDTENLGIDWVTKATATAASRPMVWPFTNESANKYVPDAFPGYANKDDYSDSFTYGTLNFSQLQAVFEMLKSKSDTNILSNPRIVTLDNKSARITVGSQYPIPMYTYNEEQAKLQVSGWEYKDIGIVFDVTPHVNAAGFVSLDIEPKITAILDYVTVENTSLPRLSNEMTKTSVIVKGGETLVIAGLIKNQKTVTKKKTPLLGDIPLLGLAFQKSNTSDSKTDLIIFVTPHIITPEIPSAK